MTLQKKIKSFYKNIIYTRARKRARRERFSAAPKKK